MRAILALFALTSLCLVPAVAADHEENAPNVGIVRMDHGPEGQRYVQVCVPVLDTNVYVHGEYGTIVYLFGTPFLRMGLGAWADSEPC